MAIMKWEPKRELDTIHTNLRRMFEDFDRNFFANSQTGGQSAYLPAADINEDKENLYFLMELPGVSEADVKLTVSDGILTVRGEKKRNSEHHDRSHYRLERSYGEFVRQYALPEDIKEEDIKANFENGVLEIVVPKSEPVKPKEREVQISSKKTQSQLNQSGVNGSSNQNQQTANVQRDKSREVHVNESGKLSNVKQSASASAAQQN